MAHTPKYTPKKFCCPFLFCRWHGPCIPSRGIPGKEKGVFFEVASCSHLRNQPSTCRIIRESEPASGPVSNTLPKEMALGVMSRASIVWTSFSVSLPSRICIMCSPYPPLRSGLAFAVNLPISPQIERIFFPAAVAFDQGVKEKISNLGDAQSIFPVRSGSR